MNKVTKVIAAILAILVSAGATGIYATVHADNKEDTKATVTDTVKEDKKEDREASDSAKAEKDETVYVISNNDGTVKNIIVSNWLKNAGALSEIDDITDLTEIENVKGDEAFTQDGTDIKWSADGDDIYYRGNCDKTLPVTMKVTYYLDGEEISPSELVGKSGNVTIRYDYTNNEKRTIDGKDVYVPFVMVTGVALDNDKFTNVEVSSGKILTNGNTTIAMGYALPGMKESLNLKDDDKLDLPDYLEITADVKDFELDEAVSTAINLKLDNDEDNLNSDSGNLVASLGKLSDASQQLCNGTSDLYNGVSELLDKSKGLSDGMNTLNNGITELGSGADALANGLTQINSGAQSLSAGATNFNAGIASAKSGADTIAQKGAELKAGADKLSAGMTSVSDGATKLNAGIDTAYTNLQTTIEANKKVLSGLEAMYQSTKSQDVLTMAETLKQTIAGQEQIANSMKAGNGGLKDGATAIAQGSAQLESGVSAISDGAGKLSAGATQLEGGLDKLYAGSAQIKTGADTLAKSTAQASEGANNLSAGITKLKAGSNALNDGINQLIGGISQLKDGSLKLRDGMNEFNDTGIQKLIGAFDGDIEGLLDRVKAVKEASNDYTTYSGASEDMTSSVKFIYTTEEIGK